MYDILVVSGDMPCAIVTVLLKHCWHSAVTVGYRMTATLCAVMQGCQPFACHRHKIVTIDNLPWLQVGSLGNEFGI